MNLIKARLVSLANTYNSIEMIKFIEKIWLMIQNEAGHYA